VKTQLQVDLLNRIILLGKKLSRALGRIVKEEGFEFCIDGCGVKRGMTIDICHAAGILFLEPAWRRHYSQSMSKRQPNGKEIAGVAPRDEIWLKELNKKT
jgi:hypothetical protein